MLATRGLGGTVPGLASAGMGARVYAVVQAALGGPSLLTRKLPPRRYVEYTPAERKKNLDAARVSKLWHGAGVEDVTGELSALASDAAETLRAPAAARRANVAQELQEDDTPLRLLLLL